MASDSVSKHDPCSVLRALKCCNIVFGNLGSHWIMNFKLCFQRALYRKGHVQSKLHSVLARMCFFFPTYLPLVEELCCFVSTEDRNFLSLDIGTSLYMLLQVVQRF